MVSLIIVGFVLGAIYGSFLNMLLWRLPQRMGIGGRSRCIMCDNTLAWRDLVPIFSFLFLFGKCRYCRGRIPIRYLLVELICGVAVAGLTVNGLTSLHWLEIAAFLVFLGLFLFDLYFYLLPDAITLPTVIVFGLYRLWTWEINTIIFSLLYGGFFAILYIVSRGKWLGFGDIKLMLVVGMVFGYPFGFLVIIGGIWLGAVVAIITLVTKRKAWEDSLPLGAFVSLAALLFIIFHHELQYVGNFFQ